MRTEKQIEASRQNGRKSCGPKTPEGKATSRRNAYKHGLTGSGAVLDRELDDEVAAEVAIYRKEFRPREGVETRLVDLMALASVRQYRCHAAAESLTKRCRRQAVRDWDDARADAVADAAAQLPTNPGAALAVLERIAEGCDYLCDRWDELAETLNSAGHWTGHQEEFAVRLLGEIKPPKAVTPGVAARLALCSMATRPGLIPGVADIYFGRAGGLALLPNADLAREELKQIVAAERARLAELGDRLWEQHDAPDRAAAPQVALAATDAESHRLAGYAVAARRMYQGALRDLQSIRRDDRRERSAPSHPAPAPAPTPSPANEPRPAPAPATANEPRAAASQVASRPAPAANEPRARADSTRANAPSPSPSPTNEPERRGPAGFDPAAPPS